MAILATHCYLLQVTDVINNLPGRRLQLPPGKTPGHYRQDHRSQEAGDGHDGYHFYQGKTAISL